MPKRMIKNLLQAFLFAVLLSFSAKAAPPAVSDAAAEVTARDEGFWQKCQNDSDSVTSRDLFAYALALGEAGQHPERLDRLFELAEQMQDRDPYSLGYGNFWWTRRDQKVMDYNAVDFCMRGGSLLWLRHRDFVPPAARERLKNMLALATQGCLRQQVKPSYSNIAIMNAGDLILLGESLDEPEAAAEGYVRFDNFFRHTQVSGIHEFDSPTYTGVDLDGLEMIATFAGRESGRTQARALLELFWTDIALNWFPPAQRLAGAQSRTYDYLYGLGELDRQLSVQGWIQPEPPSVDTIFSLLGTWRPPERIRSLSESYPRLVRESWGPEWWQSRTHYLLPDITLSCTASSYGGQMDMPLTVDLGGGRKTVRGYFIADGRGDPYGKQKIQAGPHDKAFHLSPFWTAAQRKTDAVGLVMYRQKDIPADATTLNSDFVMPMAVDSLWLGERPIDLKSSKPFREELRPGEALAARKHNAVWGIRVPWSRGLDGQPAGIFLIYDGNPFGAIRLTVEHAASGTPQFSGNYAGAVFWLRIGNGITNEAAFAEWRRNFQAAAAQVVATPISVKLNVSGQDGDLSLAGGAPWSRPTLLSPQPTRAALEFNGQDIGAGILAGHGG